MGFILPLIIQFVAFVLVHKEVCFNFRTLLAKLVKNGHLIKNLTK